MNAVFSTTLALIFATTSPGPAFAGSTLSDDTPEEHKLEKIAEQAKQVTKTETNSGAAIATAGITKVEAKEDEKKPSKPWSAGITLGHSVTTGTFLAHEQMRAYKDSVMQSWSANGSYRFDVLGHKLSVSGRLGFSLALHTPNNSLDRRFFLGDGNVSLSDGSIYKDEYTGINLRGGLSLSIPISPESRHREKWTVLGTSLGLSRKFGSLNLSYGFGFTKFFHGSVVGIQNKSVTRSSDDVFLRAQADKANCTPGTDVNEAQFSRCYAGSANADFAIRNGISVNYSFTDYLGLGYSLSLSHTRKLNLHPEPDEYQSVNAQNDRGGSDSFSTSLSLSYKITEHLGDALDLPFSLSASLGISTGHPVFTADQKRIRWPLFYNSMGEDYGNLSAIPENAGNNQNYAAANYGGFNFNLSGSF